MQTAAPGRWMVRHPVLSIVVALLVIGTVGSAFGDDSEDRPSESASSASDAAAGPSADQDGESSSRAEASDSSRDADSASDAQRKARSSRRKPAPRPTPVQRTFYVSRVVDGDTIELGTGAVVRLVGIDTPEVGECGFEPASASMERLVLGRQVRLTASDEDRDRYGRLLRYVNIGTMDAGLRQIKGGYAIARYDSRDGYGFHPREPIYTRADQAARNLTCPNPVPLAAPVPPPAAGACAPGYSPCVPPYPPDVDCPDVDGPIRVTGSDPHGLDADGDGLACE